MEVRGLANILLMVLLTTTDSQACVGINLSRYQTYHITSPNYPSAYRNNDRLCWNFMAPPDAIITYSFVSDFSLESDEFCGQDYVILWDVESSTSLGKICGSMESGMTSGRSLKVTFRSDGSRTATGFKLAVKVLSCSVMHLLNNQTKYITSPYYHPNYTYPNNHKQCWILTVPQSSIVAHSFVSDFSLEPPEYGHCYDYVSLSGEHPTSVSKNCGSTRPGSGITSGRSLTVTFKSDKSSGGQGFKLAVSAQNCDGSYIPPGETKNITSPNYPLNYGDNQTICWTFRTRRDHIITYKFVSDFSLEFEDPCSRDYVALWDVVGSTSLGKSCGSTRPGSGMTSGNSLTVTFKSDGSGTFTGFKLSLTVLKCVKYVLVPGEIEHISSPNHPSNYQNDMKRCWIFRASERVPATAIVTYSFVSNFALEFDDFCSRDYVGLLDADSSTSLAKSCGSKRPESGMTSGRSLTVTFSSDGSGTAAEFQLDVAALNCSVINLVLGQTQYITSPNYPKNYTNDQKSCWTINVNKTNEMSFQTITYSFVSIFSLEFDELCSRDYVMLSDVDNSTSLGKNCGSKHPESGITVGRSLTVTFRSDGSGTATGFNLSVNALDIQAEYVYAITNSPSITLECGANCSANGGHSSEDITWYKDGRLFRPNTNRITLEYRRIFLKRLQKTDSGTYRCLIRTQDTVCPTEFRLIVYTKIKEICGKPKIPKIGKRGRIVGGQDAIYGNAPWQVMIYYTGTSPQIRDRVFCAGVLISDDLVLTAGHCIRNKLDGITGFNEIYDFSLRFGKYKRESVDVGEVNITITEYHHYVEHHKYTPTLTKFAYDVAVFHLSKKVNISAQILPICLGTENMSLATKTSGKDAVVVGWGSLGLVDEKPDLLQTVTIPIQTKSECQNSTNIHVDESRFCAGDGTAIEAGGRDACFGDSGGPLAVKDNGAWYVVGVVSSGEGCAIQGKYGLYTNITFPSIRQWILKMDDQININ